MNEFEFINKIKNIEKNHQIKLSIGDDTAIIENNLLVCSDSLVENVHFSFEYFNLSDIIRKAILVNLSDILAMNGTPLYYLLNISIPESITDKLGSIAETLRKINRHYNIDVIGGDTTSSRQGVFVSVTMIGRADKHITRQGTEPGDYIYICGFPGKSALALNLLQKGIKPEKIEYLNYHISPPVNFEYLKLFREIKINSMIDISDGLLNDLNHILKASNTGAEIDEEVFYDNLDFSLQAKYYELNPMDLIYNGGEDFFPLFTSPLPPSEVFEKSENLGLEIYHIGKIVKGNKILNKYGKELIPNGYLHF